MLWNLWALAQAADPAPITLRGHRTPDRCVAAELELDGILAGGVPQVLHVDGDGIVGGTAVIGRSGRSDLITLKVVGDGGSGKVFLPPLLSAARYDITLTLRCVAPTGPWTAFRNGVARELMSSVRASVAADPVAGGPNVGCAPDGLAFKAVKAAALDLGDARVDLELVAGMVDLAALAEACVPLAAVAFERRLTEGNPPPPPVPVVSKGAPVSDAELRSCTLDVATLVPQAARPNEWRETYAAWCAGRARLPALAKEEEALWASLRTAVAAIRDDLADDRVVWNVPHTVDVRIDVADATQAKGSYFTPQFGVGMGAALGGRAPTFALTPYLGVAIYTRPIDRAVPLSRTGDFRRRVGGVLGATAYVPAVDPLGAEIDSLLGEFGLVGGVTLRVARYLDLVGLVAPYRVLTTDPLDDRFRLGSTVSVGLAFDADLWAAIQTIAL